AWYAAARQLDALLAARPDDLALYRARARANVLAGRWAHAAADLRRVLQESCWDVEAARPRKGPAVQVRTPVGRVRLSCLTRPYLGEAEGCRRDLRGLLAAYGRTDDAELAGALAWLAVLVADPQTDPTLTVALARKAAGRAPGGVQQTR